MAISNEEATSQLINAHVGTAKRLKKSLDTTNNNQPPKPSEDEIDTFFADVDEASGHNKKK
jgi:hypothetical protein